jgi:hypothetical protein
MDRIAVCGTVDPGSIPSRRTSVGKAINWRVGRVVYGARLESVWAKVRRGSNPLPSAKKSFGLE